MKKYIYLALAAVCILAINYSYNIYKKSIYYKELYNRELANVEAYELRNSKLNNDIREFQYTIDELRTSNDSIHQKLLEKAEELKIKDKNIKYLQYQSSVIHRIDTIKIAGDTIFKETMVPLDTIIGDKWYNLKMKLEYPSTVIVSPTFNSEKYVIVNTKKEYNKKPSKIFFIRWFQKKHTIVTVNVVEENPYIDNKENVFISIVKD